MDSQELPWKHHHLPSSIPTSDTDVQEILDGEVIDLSAQVSNRLSIRFNPGVDLGNGSVQLELSGAKTHIQTENILPYTLFGDVSADYSGLEFCPGEYTVTATTYSGPNLTGVAGDPVTIHFQLDGTALFIDTLTLVNALLDKDIVRLREGDEIVALSDGISIRAGTDNCVESVQMLLKNDSDEVLSSQTENITPYSILGDEPRGDYHPGSLNW